MYKSHDFRPYLFKTTDYGATWTRLTSGLNGIPQFDRGGRSRAKQQRSGNQHPLLLHVFPLLVLRMRAPVHRGPELVISR